MSKSESSSFEDLSADLKTNDRNVTERSTEWQDVLGSGHLLRRIIREGNVALKPQRGDICVISFTGFLRNEKIVEQQKNFEIQLGDGDVIQGVDLVIPLMRDKEISEIQVSSRFGYGEIGLPPDVPPNSELKYIVELVSFRPEPELETLSLKERQLIGNKKRERGNWWYSMQEPMMAVQCYRKAINYLDESSGGISEPTVDGKFDFGSDELRSLLDDRIKAYNNMAAAQIKMGAYSAALTSVETVLSCQPNNVKALFRKGRILAYKNDIPEALKVVKKALSLSPNDKAVKAELVRLEMREKNDSQKERDLARKMFGESLGSKSDSGKGKPKKNGKKWVFVWGVVFSVAIGAVSIALYKYKIM